MVVGSAQGYYKALWQNDIPCDLMHASEMDHPDKYRLLVLPFAFCLREKVAQRIKEFVQAGGTVVADSYFGMFAEGCIPATTFPTCGLHSLFRVKETDAELVERSLIKPRGVQEWFAGVGSLTGYHFREGLQPLPGSEVVGEYEDGTPAIVRNRHGTGHTVLFASLMGYGYHQATDCSLGQVLGAIANSAGVSRPVEVACSQGCMVRAKVRRHGQESITFCLNFGSECTVRLRLHLGPMGAVRDLIAGTTVDCALAGRDPEIELAMPAKGVKVLLCSAL